MSISIRLFLLVVAALTVVSAALSFVFIRSYTDRITREFERRGRMVAANFSARLTDDIVVEDLDSMTTHLKKLVARTDIAFARIMNQSGIILAEMYDDGLAPASAADPLPTIIRMSEDFSAIRRIKDIRLLLLHVNVYAGHPVPVGAVRIAVSLESLDRELRDTLRSSLTMIILLLSIVLLGSYFFARSLTRPILHLAEISKKMGSGDYHQEIAINRHDEIGELADGFREMRAGIIGRDSELARINANLENLVQERTRDLKVANRQLSESLDKVESAQETLLHSSKMSALGEMAGGVAHEVNSPLTVIAGSAEQMIDLIDAGQPDLPFIRECAERISKTTMRISSIVKGLRTFSRDGSNDPRASFCCA